MALSHEPTTLQNGSCDPGVPKSWSALRWSQIDANCPWQSFPRKSRAAGVLELIALAQRVPAAKKPFRIRYRWAPNLGGTWPQDPGALRRPLQGRKGLWECEAWLLAMLRILLTYMPYRYSLKLAFKMWGPTYHDGK